MVKTAWNLFLSGVGCVMDRIERRRLLISLWLGEIGLIVAIAVGGLVLVTVFAPQPMERIVWKGLFGIGETQEERASFSIYEYIHSFNTGLTDAEERELASLIYFESAKYGYDPAFILALIQTESAFDHTAVSNKGACGLMQLMPTTAREIAYEVRIPYEGETTLTNPDVNVRMGMYYLFKMMLQFKDLRLALVAYNCGPGFVEEMQKRGYRLPEDYVDKVMGNYEKIKIQGM